MYTKKTVSEEKESADRMENPMALDYNDNHAKKKGNFRRFGSQGARFSRKRFRQKEVYLSTKFTTISG